MSAALFGHSLTLNFCVGIAIVFISMHYFFSMGGSALQVICLTGVFAHEHTGTCISLLPRWVWQYISEPAPPSSHVHCLISALRLPSTTTPCAGSLKGGAASGGSGKDHGGGGGGTKLAVSPSMDHLLSLSTVQSNASVANMAAVGGGGSNGSGGGGGGGGLGDPEAGVPTLGGAARVPVLLPR